MKVLNFKMLENEHWWGGTVGFAEEMPFDKDTIKLVDLDKHVYTQTATLFLSDKGRVIWSKEKYKINFNLGDISIEGIDDVSLIEAGSTLREAYLFAMNNYFPFEKDIHINRFFFQNPQFNTWMEFIKEQTEENVIAYAEEIVANGYTPGVIMIDDGWQQAIGTWEFNGLYYKNPKKMIDRLHELGFKVMLWICPFVCLDSPDYVKLKEKVHNKGVDHLVRTEDGSVGIFSWWNGYSGLLDMRKEGDVKFIKDQLDHLINEYGVDGFKFDGGAYVYWCINGEIKGNPKREELCRVWTEFCAQYEFHEFKDTFNAGGKPYVQRLWDKGHKWKGFNSLESLVPAGCFVGLIGSPFICPDMVGGGSWTAFLEEPVNNELFMRWAECSALFPMIQFSYLPWRHTSEQCAKVCFDMSKLHNKFAPYIEECVKNAEQTGEPILRFMEYSYPNQGYAKIIDQFMLGEDVLVSPVLDAGEVTKNVVLPQGEWIDGNDGKVYQGNQTIKMDAPVDKLLYFTRKK